MAIVNPTDAPVVELSVDSIADLKALPGGIFKHVLVDGYYTAGDGGGGLFTWNDTDATADDGGIVVAPSLSGTGRWNRAYDQAQGYNIRWFGCKIDNVTNDAAGLVLAFNRIKADGGGELFHPGGRCRIATKITLDEMPAYRVTGAAGRATHISTQFEVGRYSVFVNAVGGTMFEQKGTIIANHVWTGNSRWEHIAFEGYLDNANNVAFDSQNGADKTVFEHCAFLGGKYGWTATGATVFDVLFRDVDFFRVSVAGCFLPQSGSSDFLQIRWEDCVARYNGYFVDAATGNSFYFKNCIVEANNSGGVRLDNVFTTRIESSHFEQNAIGGAAHFDVEIKATVVQPKNLLIDGSTFTMDTTHNQVKQVTIADTNKMLFIGNRSIGTGVATASIEVATPGGRECCFIENSFDVPYTVSGATEVKVIKAIPPTVYSPVWTTTGVAPSLGNGTLTGRYSVLGDNVHIEIQFIAGNTTTFGTGTFLFSLPFAAAGTFVAFHAVKIGDAGTANLPGYAQIAAGASNMSLVTGTVAGMVNVDANNPMVWTTNDRFDAVIDYVRA